jgi:hypothetical protein
LLTFRSSSNSTNGCSLTLSVKNGRCRPVRVTHTVGPAALLVLMVVVMVVDSDAGRGAPVADTFTRNWVRWLSGKCSEREW